MSRFFQRDLTDCSIILETELCKCNFSVKNTPIVFLRESCSERYVTSPFPLPSFSLLRIPSAMRSDAEA